MRGFVLTIPYSTDDNSALDDLNRVSEAIGGSNNVLDLSSGAGDASLQSPAGSAMGVDGTAEGAAPEGVFGQDSPLGFGLGGKSSLRLTFSIPLVTDALCRDRRKAVEETHSDFDWAEDCQALNGRRADRSRAQRLSPE